MSNTSCSIWFHLDGQIGQARFDHRLTHAQEFFTEIEKILKSHVGFFGRLDALGTCVGPGRFNGLRVGLGFITTLMELYQLPLYACTAHQLLAEQIAVQNQPLQGYALFAKHGFAYWCEGEDWWQPSLQPINQLPTQIATLGLDDLGVVQASSLDIANLEQIMQQGKARLYQTSEAIEPLYVGHMLAHKA